MTEEEAKTKTCHLSIGLPPIYDQSGVGIRDGGPWACLASGCMAWRWTGFPAERLGYCGLAGKP